MGSSIWRNLKNYLIQLKISLRPTLKNWKRWRNNRGIRGGIDSSVVAFLCVKALGKGKVFGLIMPEKESSPENIRDAEEIAKILKIKYEKIDLTPLLEKIGVYKHIPPVTLKNKFLVEKSFETYIKSKGGKMLHSAGAFGMTTSDRLAQRVTQLPCCQN